MMSARSAPSPVNLDFPVSANFRVALFAHDRIMYEHCDTPTVLRQVYHGSYYRPAGLARFRARCELAAGTSRAIHSGSAKAAAWTFGL